MEQLKPYRTPIAVAGATVVVVLALMLAFVLPEGHKLSALDAQRQTLALQERVLQADIVALQHDKAQQVSNCGTLGHVLQEVPPALDEGQFVLDVGALAQHSGAPSIPSLTWGASTSGAGVDSVAVTLTLAGTFGQVMSFVRGLDGASFPRLFTVSTFTVGAAGSVPGSGAGSSGALTNPVVVGKSLPSPSAPGYQVSLAGHIYYAPTLHDVCAGLKTAA
ncbi:MAG: hypothetical protein M0Z82_16800 [Actinomycetota bacterium]|jgi:Tfp pilus assembly protein PilO|nr:hypothetical protein [Actinomycetota bacterium]